MREFSFRIGTEILFGPGKVCQLQDILGKLNAHKVYVLSGHHVGKTEAFLKAVSSIESLGYETLVDTDAVPEPPVESCDAAAARMRGSGCDVCIAIGGGSVIDTAKAICMLARNEGSAADYLFGGTRTVQKEGIPLIAVPTTAGSGSEVTAASVITDTSRDVKLSITHPFLIPKYAVIDPLMQLDMPEGVTAATGMDALTHAIESYTSLHAGAFSDACGQKAIRMISGNLRTAVFDPHDLEARSQMAAASTLAGIAFLNGGLGVVHGITQAMGGIAHVSHGVANAMMLPYVIRTNIPGNVKKFAEIARLMGEDTAGMPEREAAELAADAVRRLADDVRIPSRLSEVGVTEDMFPKIIEETMAYRLLPQNPVRIRPEDVRNILQQAL